MRARIVSVVVRAAVVAALFAATVPTGSWGAPDSTCYKYRTGESWMADKINRARRNKGKPALQLDPELSRVAKYHTREMIEADELYHTPAKKLGRRVTEWDVLGENVGFGGSAKTLHNAFMNSKTHRRNILRREFRHLGIGILQADGQTWVTVIFEAQRNPGTRLNMPDC